MRQGNTHRHLPLHYPGLWKVKNDVYFIFFEWLQSDGACLCLREWTGKAELGTAVRDVGSRRGLQGFGGVGHGGHSTLPRKSTIPTLWVPAM